MTTFRVDDMSCAHCVAVLTRALTRVDPDARVDIDLDAHRVVVESARAPADAFAAAMQDAGYTPALVTAG